MACRSSSNTISRSLLKGGIFLVLVSALLLSPTAARTDMSHIQPGDMIFIYEQNLDITGLRTGGYIVTSLRKYQSDNPTQALLQEVPVADDTSFTLLPEAFGNLMGIYYAYNATAGTMGSVSVSIPTVSIDAFLANPNHSDSIEGLSIPSDTRIAFRITSIDVGASYHAGSLYPATVDLVLTTPGGAQLTTIQGLDFSGRSLMMNLSSQAFYTDDPGRPGAITIGTMGAGTYSVQAQWRDPSSFYHQAPDSNIISFTVEGTTVSQTTAAPVITPATTLSPVSTPAPVTTPATTPTAPATTPTTTVTTVPPTVQPGTPSPTETSAPSPTPMPTTAWLALFAPAIALLLRARSGAGR